MAVAQRAKGLAQDGFGGAAQVEAISLGNGKARVSAAGATVSFIEFGVGKSGEGTYQGELPTQDITFTARNGKEHTTSGWVYNYYVKEIDKKAKDHIGFVAKAPMWHTANRLEQGEAINAVEQLFKERDI